MTRQSNNFTQQEAASKAFNNYIQYLWIFEEAEAEQKKGDENAAKLLERHTRPTMPHKHS
jgi:hypothetical protein